MVMSDWSKLIDFSLCLTWNRSMAIRVEFMLMDDLLMSFVAEHPQFDGNAHSRTPLLRLILLHFLQPVRLATTIQQYLKSLNFSLE